MDLGHSHHDKETEGRFDFKIFQCVDLALSTIGENEKDQVLITLERRFGLSGRDLAKHPSRLEEYLGEIFGISEAAFVIIHIRDNIAKSFGLEIGNLATFSEAVDLARSSFASPILVRPNVNR